MSILHPGYIPDEPDDDPTTGPPSTPINEATRLLERMRTEAFAECSLAEAVEGALVKLLEEADTLRAELAAEREKHDEEAYNDMRAAKDAAESSVASLTAKLEEARGCLNGDNCACAIGSRHFWLEAFSKERERVFTLTAKLEEVTADNDARQKVIENVIYAIEGKAPPNASMANHSVVRRAIRGIEVIRAEMQQQVSTLTADVERLTQERRNILRSVLSQQARANALTSEVTRLREALAGIKMHCTDADRQGNLVFQIIRRVDAVLAPAPRLDLVVCSTCQGDGKFHGIGHDACVTCGGSGRIHRWVAPAPPTPEAQICDHNSPDCKGHGDF